MQKNMDKETLNIILWILVITMAIWIFAPTPNPDWYDYIPGYGP